MTRRIIAVLAATVLAMVGTGAIFAYAKRADNRALAGQQAVTILIAQQPIKTGMTLKTAVATGLMKAELVARKAAPVGALTAVDVANEGQVALSDISQGEVLMSSRFGKEVPRPDSLDIPAGKMAVTVELADPQRVAPFLRAGDEVAIFTSFKNRRIPKKDEPKADGECGYPELCATQVVLTRVLVLGVGEATTKPAPKRKVDDEIAPSAQEEQEQRAQITLALTQKEAAKVVHLSFFGNMHFALLNDRSVIDKETAGVNDNNFFADK